MRSARNQMFSYYALTWAIPNPYMLVYNIYDYTHMYLPY